MTSLFQHLKPLAERIRPDNLDDVLNLTEQQRKFLKQDKIPSIVLYGAPGTGKTTIARTFKNRYNFKEFQAVSTSVKDLRTEMLRYDCTNPLILFIDEIHRLSKSQQDIFLPFLESGAVVLIGATTESPYYYLNQALISRIRVVKIDSFTREEYLKIVPKIEKELETKFSEDLIYNAIEFASGDLRKFINYLENPNQEQNFSNTKHDLVSAMIKSLRYSDEQAGLFYCFYLLNVGEDPEYIFRRLIIFASEDIGIINPEASILASSLYSSFKQIGLPEGKILLSQLVVYLANSKKSRYSYQKLKIVENIIGQNQSFLIPLHLRYGNKEKEIKDNLSENIRRSFNDITNG